MSLVVVTVVKDDVTGLIRTRASVHDQSKTPKWIAITPFDSSETHKLCLNLLGNGEIERLIEDEGTGVYSAMNKAIFESPATDWLWFLNAGDEFSSTDAYEIVSGKISTGGFRWLYGGFFLGSENGEILGEFLTPKEFKISNQLFARKFLSHQATIFQAKFLQELRGFNSNYKIAADWDLMCRASIVAVPERIEKPLCVFYMGGLSTKSRNLANVELLKIRSTLLPWRYILKSYAWYSYRSLRNIIVQSIEGVNPQFADSTRRFRLTQKRAWRSRG